MNLTPSMAENSVFPSVNCLDIHFIVKACIWVLMQTCMALSFSTNWLKVFVSWEEKKGRKEWRKEVMNEGGKVRKKEGKKEGRKEGNKRTASRSNNSCRCYYFFSVFGIKCP